MKEYCGTCKYIKENSSNNQNDYPKFYCGNEDSDNYMDPTMPDEIWCGDWEELDEQ